MIRAVATDDIEKRRANRLRVLNFIYEAASGSRQININGPWLVENIDMPEDELADACMYLVDERLIEGSKTIWSSYIPFTTRLTHRGLMEMERSLSAPEEPTERFPAAFTIISIAGDNIGSPIQAGSPAAQQIATATGIDLGKLREVVSGYEACAQDLNLPDDDAAQLRADIATIKAQVESPQPNEQTIRTHLVSARGFLVNASANTVGGFAGAGLLELIQHIRL